MYRGTDAQGRPIFQQKRVDLMIGLDIAGLAAKKRITHAAVFSGDSDLLPAVEEAQREGIAVWLVHDPREPTLRSCGRWPTIDSRSTTPIS